MGRVFTNFAASLVQSVRKRYFTRTLQRQETSGHHCWYKYSPTSCSKVCCHSVVTEVCGNRCLGSGPCAIRENIEYVSVVLNKPADDMDSNLSAGVLPYPCPGLFTAVRSWPVWGFHTSWQYQWDSIVSHGQETGSLSLSKCMFGSTINSTLTGVCFGFILQKWNLFLSFFLSPKHFNNIKSTSLSKVWLSTFFFAVSLGSSTRQW